MMMTMTMMMIINYKCYFQCSYSDCVNLSSPRAPFYLHGPTRADCQSHQNGGGNNRNDSFFLHNPQEIVYNRVKDLFEGPVKSEASSENELIGNTKIGFDV